MKLYNDEKLTTEISDLEFGRVEVGETKLKTFWLYNDSKAFVEDVKVIVDKFIGSEEVTILSFPKEMKPNSKAAIEISWTPTLKIEAGLRAKLQISGVKVWE